MWILEPHSGSLLPTPAGSALALSGRAADSPLARCAQERQPVQGAGVQVRARRAGAEDAGCTSAVEGTGYALGWTHWGLGIRERGAPGPSPTDRWPRASRQSLWARWPGAKGAAQGERGGGLQVSVGPPPCGATPGSAFEGAGSPVAGVH